MSALAFTSCEDFFDTSSKKDLNTETAYSNLESAEMALVGCYDGWQRTISDEGVGMYLLAEFASEQAFAGLGLSDAKNNNVIDQFNLGIAPSYNDIFNVDWQNYYKAIFRCNQLIVQEDNIDWAGDIKAQGRVMGEAHAIRGILYFDLVRMFGDVPLLTAPSEENIPRSPASDVYQLIFEDFKYAIEHIPADAYPLDNNDTNDGRITKYAAEALMARAYLYHTGYYGAEHPSCTKAEAVAAINDVVQNGKYELGGQEVTMKDRKATLADGTIAGSATCLFDCMKSVISMGVPEREAVLAATANPARSIGIYDEVGSLTPGKRADIVLTDEELNIVKVL